MLLLGFADACVSLKENTGYLKYLIGLLRIFLLVFINHYFYDFFI